MKSDDNGAEAQTEETVDENVAVAPAALPDVMQFSSQFLCVGGHLPGAVRRAFQPA